IKQRDHSKSGFLQAVIIRERPAQSSRADNSHTMWLIQAKNFRQMTAQVVDEVSGAPHAKFTEITEVFANLRRIQIELLGEFLRRNGSDAGGREFVQAAQVYA